MILLLRYTLSKQLILMHVTGKGMTSGLLPQDLQSEKCSPPMVMGSQLILCLKASIVTNLP